MFALVVSTVICSRYVLSKSSCFPAGQPLAQNDDGFVRLTPLMLINPTTYDTGMGRCGAKRPVSTRYVLK